MAEPHNAPENAHAHRKKRWRSRYSTRSLHVVRNFFLALLALTGITAVALWTWLQPVLADTPKVDDLLNVRLAEPSVLLSANGTRLAVYSQGRQQRVSLDAISPHVVEALIATEDRRFYTHHGIDWQRTAAAAFHTVKGDAQGGSTITQQLARNLFPEDIGRQRTIVRKLKEMATARKIESVYSKEQILESYLNTVPFLYNVVGIEMAARTYYDKPASELNVQESATLIGMLKGTSYYNPVSQPGRAMQRRNVVLQQMVKAGTLNETDYEAMREQPLQVKFRRESESPECGVTCAPHFAEYVRKWLLDWTRTHGYNLYTDGLTIDSSIDDRLQQAALDAVERQARVLQDIADVEWAQPGARVLSHTPSTYSAQQKRVQPFRHFWDEKRELLDAFVRDTPSYRKAVAAGQRGEDVLKKLKADPTFLQQVRENRTRLEAGFIAIDPASGTVKAWVGSRDFARDQFDHVGQAMRQPGSTFKPIVYGAALESGISPEHLYQDVPVQIRSADGSVWRPTDMSGWSGRIMPMREGLVYSRNGITAQVMRDIGVPGIIDFAHAAGIRQSKLYAVPSLSLGTSPVTLLEMASAYTTIARGGDYAAPLTVTRIRDRHGKVVAEFHAQGQRAMSEQTAFELIDMMRGVVSAGTGTGVRQQVGWNTDVAGKTGTTQNNTDGWFLLMHPQLVAGAWVGFNDARVTMRSSYWGQGGHNAVLLVGDFFRNALREGVIDAKMRFPQPLREPPLFVQEGQDDAWPVVTPADSLAGGNGEVMSFATPGAMQDVPTVRADPYMSSGSSAPNTMSSSDVQRDAQERGRLPSPTDVNVW